MKKTILIAIVACLLVAVLVGVLANVTGGFRNWDVKTWNEKERNPENLLKLTSYVDDREFLENGTKIEIQPDGSLTFTQPAESENGNSTFFEFATLTLNPGTYTYTGSPDGSVTTYKLIADYTHDGNEEIGSIPIDRRVYSDNTGSRTFTLDEKTEVSFKLFIADNYTGSATVYPTLAKGEDAIDFYLK